MGERERDKSIDVLKGIGILLIVLGHMPGVHPTIITWIYSFHVPLFFLTAGFLFDRKNCEIKFVKFVWKKIMRLIIPLLVLEIPLALFEIFKSRNDIHQIILILQDELSWKFNIGAAWFLPCMFFALILFWLYIKVVKEEFILISTVVYVLILDICYNSFDFTGYIMSCIGRIAIALMFLMLGYLLKRIKKADIKYRRILLIITLTASIAMAVVNSRGSYVDLNCMVLNNFVLYVLSGIVGTIFCYLLASFCKGIYWLDFLGKSTIIILLTHQPLRKIGIFVLSHVLHWKVDDINGIKTILLFLFIMLIETLMCYCIKRLERRV